MNRFPLFDLLYSHSSLIPSSHRPFWDISVVSNVWTRVHDPYAGFPPHPQLEQQRAVLVAKLRRNYQEICLNREGSRSKLRSPFLGDSEVS